MNAAPIFKTNTLFSFRLFLPFILAIISLNVTSEELDATDKLAKSDIQFELADDEQLKNVQVAGMFKTGDVTGLLNVLSQNFNISYEKVSSDKIILKYSG